MKKPTPRAGTSVARWAKACAFPALVSLGDVARRRARDWRLLDRLPLTLLAGLLLVGLLMVLTQAHRYGIAVDEPLQEAYGQHVLSWYLTLGRDTSFLTAFPADTHMPEHGGIFDALIAALQSVFSGLDPWVVRRIVSGLCGLAGVGAIALCGYELGGAWLAFAAALGLWLYPRYYGAIYNNPKDVPAAVALTFVLYATLRLVKRWDARARSDETTRMLLACLSLGCTIGVATAIRVTALTWFAVLAVLLAGWWVAHPRRVWRERRLRAVLVRQGVAASAVGVGWLVATMLLWPYVFLDPFANLARSIQVLSHYPWNGLVLYRGVEYPAAQLPGDYVPTWLVVGSPPLLVPLVLLGLGIAIGALFRVRRLDPVLATVALAVTIPLGSLVVLHPVLYDSLRQFLYVVPPLILLAAFGLARGVGLLLGAHRDALRWAAVALLALTIASYAQVAFEMVALSPYEYTYFSPIVGGLPGAAGRYDTDYWATCSTASAEWLAANYGHYTHAPSPTVEGPVVEGMPMLELIAPFLPPSFREDDAHPDFVVAFTRDGNDLMRPTYPVIHVVAAEGVRLCVVKASPAIARGP